VHGGGGPDQEFTALQSPDGLLVVAAGGPAGGFGAVIPPWFGSKAQAVTQAIEIPPPRKDADMSLRVLDPTCEDTILNAARPERLTSLAGAMIGLLDNGKIRVRELLDHVREDTATRALA
jgi:hypothetical protein